MAVRIPAFIPQEKAYDVIVAIVRIFKEQDALRENRTRARIKYLFMRHGWTAETMLEAIEKPSLATSSIRPPSPRTSSPTTSTATTSASPRSGRLGLSTVGASVLRGRLSGDQLERLAELSEIHGDGQLRATIMQNIVLVNIRNEAVRQLVEDLKAIDLHVEVTPFWRGSHRLHRHRVLQAGDC